MLAMQEAIQRREAPWLPQAAFRHAQSKLGQTVSTVSSSDVGCKCLPRKMKEMGHQSREKLILRSIG